VSTQPKTILTPEQYLEIERKAQTKSEYHGGEMFAMSGASRKHNVLGGSLIGLLYPQLRSKPCELCPSHVDALLNPTFLAEILSPSTAPSTEAYDRGRKFEHYRAVESLQEYLLVAQERMHADLFTRQGDGSWLLRSYSRGEDAIELASIDCRLILGELYEELAPTGAAP